MRPWVAAVVGLWCTLASSAAMAGFTQTLPQGTLLLDEAFSRSRLTHRWDDDGNLAPLIDPIERYEPGGGLQGVLTPNTEVSYRILINQIQFGVLDQLTVGVALPMVVGTTVDLDLDWTPGDYQPTIGRPYSEEDFWEWAGSMGQPRPGSWEGNGGVVADTYLGLRYRFSDDVPWFEGSPVAASIMLIGALPTGRQADPEEIAAAGTTSWDLHSQGELGAHLSADLFLPTDAALPRLTLGLDLFYEALLAHEYRTPKGEIHPLLLAQAPYVGDTYVLDPGDFAGGSIQAEAVLWVGPDTSNWLSRRASGPLPPLLTLLARYTYTHIGQSDWRSDSDLWDWTHERLWKPGFKSTLNARLTLSLFRLGVPIQIYGAMRNQTWLGGRNCRAAGVWTVGVQVPVASLH